MTSDEQVRIDRRLVTAGAGLMVIGGLLGFVGVALAGTAVFAAGRQWIRQMEVPPREQAVQKWHQAKEATLAGAHAWRDAATNTH
jgi:hypothetical protein